MIDGATATTPPRTANGGGAAASTSRSRARTSLGEWSIRAIAGLAALFLALPVAALVVRAIVDGALAHALTTQVVLDALALSLVTTAISLMLTVGLGLPMAIVLARRSFRGQSFLEAIVDLPIVLPPSVAGIALLLAFGRNGLLGGTLASSGSPSVHDGRRVLAQTFVSMPFFIRSARTGIAGVDGDLRGRRARRRRLGTAGLPVDHGRPGSSALAAGLVMSWARALGEFGATIMFAGNLEGSTQTLPLLVYSEFQGVSLDASIAAATILILAAFGVLIAVRVFHWGRILDTRGVS